MGPVGDSAIYRGSAVCVTSLRFTIYTHEIDPFVHCAVCGKGVYFRSMYSEPKANNANRRSAIDYGDTPMGPMPPKQGVFGWGSY